MLAALLWLSSAHSAPLSESEAKSILEDDVRKGHLHIPIGEFTAHGTENNLAQARISTSYYFIVMAAESLGLVTVKKLPPDVNSVGLPTIPPHLFSQKLSVTLSEKGRALNKWSRPATWNSQNSLLALTRGTISVTRIVRNEEIKRGADEFRLVFFTYKSNFDPTYHELFSRARRLADQNSSACVPRCFIPPVMKTDRKGKVLLKRDAFKSIWTATHNDLTNEDEEFWTDNVDTFLSSR